MKNSIRFAAVLAAISVASPAVHADTPKAPPPAQDDWQEDNKSEEATPPEGNPSDYAIDDTVAPPPPDPNVPQLNPDMSPRFAFDAGPLLNTPMGKELNDLVASIPNFPQISNAVLGSQKFRPAFGPIPWRMLQQPNQVKILFIGQDGTHIAEAANRPATAGFGGRAMDLAKYFGVTSGAAFINTYAFTIKGQYGAHDAPVIHKNAQGGVDSITFNSLVDNQLWLISQDQSSPIVQWRNHLIDWIIRNNRDSLQMIVTFGGAARDAMGSFLISHGGKVGTRLSADDLKNVLVPESTMVNAGGNNEEPIPLTRAGGDGFAALTNSRVDMSKPDQVTKLEQAWAAAVKANPAGLQQLLFSKGLNGSGIIDPAQLGGYDIDQKMQVNAQAPTSISLKGLPLLDRTVINRDVLVVQLPHPTALSMMTPQQAATAVAQKLTGVKAFPQWRIQPDAGQVNRFAAGQPYVFARADIGPETYDFGAPASRMVNVSSASRLNPATIVFGTRDKVQFDQAALTAMVSSKPSQFPPADEIWTTRARGIQTRNQYDPGPPIAIAKLMKDNLPLALVKSPAHVVNTDFGHYRGSFVNPFVVILADPDGFDDLATGRALTGARGQFLNGLMQDLGVGENYLVIKTAPFSHCDDKDWADTLAQTRTYRDQMMNVVLSMRRTRLIITDGPDAAREMQRMSQLAGQIPVVNIQRTGSANNSGIVEASKQIATALGSRGTATGRMIDIPRTHLVYYERWWGGKGGDHVITAKPTDAQNFCQVFAVVAPAWATSQQLPLTPSDAVATQALLQKEAQLGILLPSQKRAAFRPTQVAAPAAGQDNAR